MEKLLRRADASLEKWYRGARKRGAGILRQRVEDLRAGLKKLSAGLGQVERERQPLAAGQPTARPPREATPAKRRARPAAARKRAATRKPKKAA